MINVKSANYGRTNNSTCCFGGTVSFYGANVVCSNTNCYMNKTDSLITACNNKTVCTFTIDISGDPCPYTYKYLDVSWECKTTNSTQSLSKYLNSLTVSKFFKLIIDNNRELIEIEKLTKI